jgi:hypothetical protein
VGSAVVSYLLVSSEIMFSVTSPLGTWTSRRNVVEVLRNTSVVGEEQEKSLAPCSELGSWFFQSEHRSRCNSRRVRVVRAIGDVF